MPEVVSSRWISLEEEPTEFGVVPQTVSQGEPRVLVPNNRVLGGAISLRGRSRLDGVGGVTLRCLINKHGCWNDQFRVEVPIADRNWNIVSLKWPFR